MEQSVEVSGDEGITNRLAPSPPGFPKSHSNYDTSSWWIAPFYNNYIDDEDQRLKVKLPRRRKDQRLKKNVMCKTTKERKGMRTIRKVI